METQLKGNALMETQLKDRAHIRRRCLIERVIYASRNKREADKGIMEKIKALPEYERAAFIFAYASNTNEAGTNLLIEDAIESGKRVALPRVTGEGTMEFYEIRGLADLHEGYRGIMEPSGDEPVDPAADSPDLIFVPGVAFDHRGYRLGYGKGFYDRYLARIPQVYSVGLAFPCQIVDEIPAHSHDIPVNTVIS